MNCRRQSAKMAVPPGNRPAVPRDWSRTVPERYVAGADNRGRQEGRPNPRSQQVIHEISGLKIMRASSEHITEWPELGSFTQLSRRCLLYG
jgi:hypothetical protein